MRARRGIGILVAGVLALPAVSFARRPPRHGNPHDEVTAFARVETAPRRTLHRNGRSFEELDVVLLSVRRSQARPYAATAFDTRGPVHVVHDLTCGGTWIDLAPGDGVELKGEYVHLPSGRDLVHFTHPADSSCGGGTHPGGFLRRQVAPAMSPALLAAFQSSVRSVLVARCSPCHEPGGRMYGRMPFDNPDVVASHAPRMAGRLSGADRRTLEEWAAAVTPAPGH